jgi:hypothetical protein
VENQRCEKENQIALFRFRAPCKTASGKFVADTVYFVFERAVFRHLALDYVDGGEDRRVIASEYFGRVLQRKIGDVANDVDGDMAREGDLRCSLFALDINSCKHKLVV